MSGLNDAQLEVARDTLRCLQALEEHQKRQWISFDRWTFVSMMLSYGASVAALAWLVAKS